VLRVLEALNREGEGDRLGGLGAAGVASKPGRRGVHDPAGASVLSALHRAEEGFRLGLELLKLVRADKGSLFDLLEQLVPMVAAVQPGGVLVCPAAHTPNGDTAFLLVLRRDDERTFSVSACATGAACLRRHPCRRNPASGHLEYSTSLTVRGVPRERLADSSFWFLLFRQPYGATTSANSSNGETALLYDVLLPALNDTPLPASACQPGEDTQIHNNKPTTTATTAASANTTTASATTTPTTTTTTTTTTAPAAAAATATATISTTTTTTLRLLLL